jgi:hypothetical protein
MRENIKVMNNVSELIIITRHFIYFGIIIEYAQQRK